MEPDIDGVAVVSGLPAGSVSRTFTVTGTSTARLNSTVQIRVTSDPTGQIGLTGSLETITVGLGTGKMRNSFNYHRKQTLFLSLFDYFFEFTLL